MASKLCIPDKKMPKATTTDYGIDKTIKKYVMRDKIVKTGEGEHDFVIVKEQVLLSEQDRSDFINSYADEVGIMNVLKKVQLTGDSSMYHAHAEQGVDATNLPKDKMEAFDAVKKGVDAFDSLPDDLKKKMSMEAFANSIDQATLDSYISAKVAELTANKGGANNE